MPFIRVEVNQEASQETINSTMIQITERVHALKGDPKEMILVVIDTQVNASFGGDFSLPVAMVNFVNLTMPSDITKKLTEAISDILLANFNVSSDRMYIYFQEITQLHLFAWNKQTFNEIAGGDNVKDLEKQIK